MKKIQAGGVLRTALDNTWRTPEYILERARICLGDPLPFDAATGPENPTGAARFCAGAPGTLFAPGEGTDLSAHQILARTNGLEQSWDWPTWVNPPYGKELRAWLLKIERELERPISRPIVALLPASRWETAYLQRLLALGCFVCLHRGRIKFVSSIDGVAVGGNPSGSMLLGWQLGRDLFCKAWSSLGTCLDVAPLAALPIGAVTHG